MTELENKFKTDWMNSAITNLFIAPEKEEFARKRLSEIFDKTFKERYLRVFNSVYYENHDINGIKFFYQIPRFCILNENGVLTKKTEVQPSIEAHALEKNVEVRQIYKRGKQTATDPLVKENFATMEQNNKIIINGEYGLSGYTGAPFFNLDLADTTTTAGRNIVSVSAMTMESIGGGWRNYDIAAYLKLIRYTKDYADKLSYEYDLPDVTVEECLKQLLLYHYDDFYAKSFLRHTLENLPKNIIQLLYMKNNYEAFIKVPQVRDILVGMFERITNGEPLYNPKNRDPNKTPVYADEILALQKMAKDLLYGFVYFSGDYIDGKFYPTLVDLIANKKRTTVVGMDTDSNNSTMFDFINITKKVYPEEIGKALDDNTIRRDSVTVICAEIMIGCIEQALWEYTTAIGIAEHLRPRIELELEHVMEHIQLCTSKKQYAFIPTITDFMINEARKMKVTGLVYIKSNFNKEIGSVVHNILFNYIMRNPAELNYAKLLNTIKVNTDLQKKSIRTEEFVRNKKTLLKITTDDIKLQDYRLKSVKFWNFMYGERIGEIELPGSFGILKIDITPEIMDEIKEIYPDEFEKIKRFTLMISKYKLCCRAKKCSTDLNDEDKFNDIMEKLNKSHPEAYKWRNTFLQISREIDKFKDDDWDPEFYRYILDTYNGSGEVVKKILIKCWGIDTKFNIDKAIIEECSRIAIPQDTTEIPEIISRNNFNLIDIKSVCEFEHLLGAMCNSLSLVCPRNINDSMVITTVLKSY